MKLFKKVTIRWLDAYSDDPWKGTTEYEFSDHICISEGYLIHETPTYVFLAGTIAKKTEGEEGYESCQLIAIPKGCIIKPKRKRK